MLRLKRLADFVLNQQLIDIDPVLQPKISKTIPNRSFAAVGMHVQGAQLRGANHSKRVRDYQTLRVG